MTAASKISRQFNSGTRKLKAERNRLLLGASCVHLHIEKDNYHKNYYSLETEWFERFAVSSGSRFHADLAWVTYTSTLRILSSLIFCGTRPTCTRTSKPESSLKIGRDWSSFFELPGLGRGALLHPTSMTQYRVFLGAPSRAETQQTLRSYQWQTVSSDFSPHASVIFPPATLEAASRRISLIYQNIIFTETDQEEFINDGQGHSSPQNFGEFLSSAISMNNSLLS